MAYIDVDLDKFDADDLIEALKNQYLDDRDKHDLMELIKDDDCPKFQLFLKVKHRYSLLELEQLFKEEFNPAVGENQLNLELK